MRIHWNRVGPYSNMTGVLTEAKTGVTSQQAKEDQGFSATLNLGERKGTDYPPEPSEGARPCQHLDFGFVASRTVIEQI